MAARDLPRRRPEPSALRRPTALVLANRLPFPLDDGWKMRAYHVVRGLARASDVTLVTFHGGDARVVEDFRASLPVPVEVLTVPPPRPHTLARVLLGLVTPLPLHVWNHRSRPLRRALADLLRRTRFDIVVAELAALYPYFSAFPPETRRIIDTHNIDSVVFRRYATTLPGALRRRYASITANKQERFERTVFAAADLLWVCSEPERERLLAMAPGACVAVVPNGFEAGLLDAHPDQRVHPRRLMFCGLMDYHPNVDAVRYFAEQILPDLKRSDPGIELWVVGRSPAPELVALAEREPAIHVTGRVDDVSALLATAAVVVVPLRAGGGTRLKILEALAMGKPVVSTRIGMEGLELAPGHDLLVADSPAAFADGVRRLLHDPAWATLVGAQGRATVRQRYEWSRIEQGLRRSLGWSACT